MPVIENNKEMIPFEHYVKLYAQMNAADAAARLGIRFDEAEKCFHMRLLYTDYRLYWPEFRIEADQADALALNSLAAQMLLIRYLLEGKSAQMRGNFLTYREMPWGEVYLRQFTGRCITRAAYAFGPKLDAFAKVMDTLGAIRLSKGDTAYQFELMPGYEIQLILWEGDDEFPPNAQILFTDNFAEGFSAEDRTVVGDLFITEFKRLMTRNSHG